MAIFYSIDRNEKLAYVTLPEKADLAEDLEVMPQLAADERLGEDFGILVDGRVTKSIPSVEEVRVIASAISNPALFLHHPTALVVSQAVQYGLGNMISIIAGMQGATFRPFYEVEEAKTWLRHLTA